MKYFEVKTQTRFATLVFLTKANDGKDALRQLQNSSGDFRQLIGRTESNNMMIEIKHLKVRK